MKCYLKESITYCLWFRFILCQDACISVWACCKFKSVLYEFVGTLYKLPFFAFEVLCLLTVGKKKSLWWNWIQNSCRIDLIVMTARNHLGLLLCIISLVELSLLFCWIWHMYAFYVTAGMCSKCLFVIESVPFTQSYVNCHLRPIINI